MRRGVFTEKKAMCFAVLLLLFILPSCGDRESSARKMYNKALNMEKERRSEEAIKIYETIVKKYPETQTAVEVNKRLLEQKRALEFIEHMTIEQMKRLIEQALSYFLLDNGRYPTTKEGLEILIRNTSNLSTWDGPYLVENGLEWSRYFDYTSREKVEYALKTK